MPRELLSWRKSATAEQWSKLAELSDTSTGYLDQLAYGFRTPSPKKASQIEEASKSFSLPVLNKENLVFDKNSSQAA